MKNLDVTLLSNDFSTNLLKSNLISSTSYVNSANIPAYSNTVYNLSSVPCANLSPAADSPSSLNPNLEVNVFATSLSDSITNAYNNVAPLKLITVSSSKKPWVTQDIRGLMRRRDHSYKEAKRSGIKADHERFRKLRREVKERLDTAKNAHYASHILAAPSMKAKWSALRNLGIAKAKFPSPLTCFTANQLNQHFRSVCTNIPPLTPSDLSGLLNSSLDNNMPSFAFELVTPENVQAAINKAKSKAVGVDGISAEMIKKLPPLSTHIIADLFNHSLASVTFPCSWKRAAIIPLAKVKNLASLKDTRPISILPELAKLLERIVFDQLTAYLEEQKLLDELQTGFRKDNSIQTAMLKLCDDVRLGIDQRKITALVLFDFSKAFDSVPHALLLRKLRKLGCSDTPLRWFYSYLYERFQSVMTEDGNPTEWLQIGAGVPQGSVLGPLLFSIFINDLPSILSASKHIIYADDLQIYYSFPPSELEEGIATISRDCNAIATWAVENGLVLNTSKCKTMILGSSQYTSRLDLKKIPKINISGNDLPYEAELKSLGVWISPNLTWERQVRLVLQKTYGSLRTLRFFSRALSRDLKKSLVETMIFPHFDFACVVFNSVDKTRDLRLQHALNACVRFVCGNIGLCDHVTPHRLQLNWLSTLNRRNYFLGCLAYKIIATQRPSYIARNFSIINSDVIVRSSARLPPATLYYKTPRTEALNESFFITASKLLNRFSPITFHAQAINRFKEFLFTTLLEDDADDWARRQNSVNL